jgi:protein-S-isoprenylcysteine O-methyltransferase Ste14
MDPDPQNRAENGMRRRLRMPGGRARSSDGSAGKRGRWPFPSSFTRWSTASSCCCGENRAACDGQGKRGAVRNKHKIHGGDLSGIILLACVTVDRVAYLIFRSDFLHLAFLHQIEWVSRLILPAGLLALTAGCAMGYLSHEAFHRAVSPDGKVRRLLREGPYRRIRHPFYLSLMLIGAAFVLLLQSGIVLLGLCAVAAILVRDALREEAHLQHIFGEDYRRYRETTGMFFPRIFG